MPAEVEEEKEISVPKALEALGLALSSPALNPDGATSLSKKGNSYTLSLPEGAFFPGGPVSKQLDLEEAMENAIDKVKHPAKPSEKDLIVPSVAVASKVTTMHREDLQ